nr:unnamed protein product [Callosobruchus analis]
MAVEVSIYVDLTKHVNELNFHTTETEFLSILQSKNPFDTDIETLAPELQMEMIDLQCSDIIKNKYQNSSLLEFFSTDTNLIICINLLVGYFLDTYLCEKTFSKMKYTKNVYRSKLTDEHLKSLLIIGISKISPQLQTIVGEITSTYKKEQVAKKVTYPYAFLFEEIRLDLGNPTLIVSCLSRWPDRL